MCQFLGMGAQIVHHAAAALLERSVHGSRSMQRLDLKVHGGWRVRVHGGVQSELGRAAGGWVGILHRKCAAPRMILRGPILE